jgi:hypothetical protein
MAKVAVTKEQTDAFMFERINESLRELVIGVWNMDWIPPYFVIGSIQADIMDGWQFRPRQMKRGGMV